MKLKRTMALLLTVLLLVSSFPIANAMQTETHMTALSTDVTYDGNDLGASYTKEGTTFKVWAPTATKVVLNRYSTGSNAEANAYSLGTVDMTQDSSTGVWHCYVEGDIVNTYYTYSVTVDGNTSETQDVYSYATGVNGERSMVVDLSSTNPDGWENDKHVLSKEQTDAVIWEIHVRDFSISATSGVSDEHKGKYLAFTEGGTTVNGNTTDAYTCIDYLVNQGVKYVHLNPVYDFGSVDETRLYDEQYNWGYDPVNYNVPEGSYSTDPYDGNVRIREFKQMVQALHDRGIGVIMDVVYNHTYSTLSSLQKTVPNYYYRMSSSGDWYNGSGCGNETKSEAPMYRKYMIDSVTYWAKEYHIDGFRFDLMGLHDYTTMNMVRESLDNLYSDGSGKQLIMYGEPWTGGPSGIPQSNQTVKANASKISDRIAFFNDSYRDAVKGSTEGADGGFIQTGNASFTTNIKAGLAGNLEGSWTAVAPTQNMIYQSAHDNLTLFDKLYKSLSSEFNDYDEYNKKAEQLTMLAETLTFTGIGIPFALAGEEFCRTKFGDRNSYNSSDEINELNWELTQKYGISTRYYKGLLAIRDAYSPFTDGSDTSAKRMYFCNSSVPTGCLAYTIDNKTENADKEWNIVAVAANTTSKEQSIKLEGYSQMPKNWVVVADGTNSGVISLGTVSGDTVKVPAYSAVILVDEESFIKAKITATEKVKIKVNHINTSTGETLKSTENLYNIGDTYRILPDQDLAFYYNYKNFEATGDTTTGIATSDEVEITFYYENPENYRGTVTLNYLDENGEQIRKPRSFKTAEGDYYRHFPDKVQGYTIDTANLPADMTGIFDTNDVVLNFKYKTIADNDVTVHYYNSDNWVRVYFYCYTVAGKEPLRAWPGTRVSTKDEDGWHVKSVEGVSEASFCFNNGSNLQDPPANMPGYKAAGEVWIKDGITTFNTTVITSHVDASGKKLVDDEVQEFEKITDKTMYTTKAKSFEGYSSVVSSDNRSGYCSAGTINVIYVYSKEELPDEQITAQRLYGDIDDNSKISMTDVTTLQKYIAKLTNLDEVSLKAADLNADSQNNLEDAVLIQRYLAELINTFEVGQYFNYTVGSNSTDSDSDSDTTVDTETTTDTNLPVESDTEDNTESDSTVDTDTATEEDEIITVYFSNNKFWDEVYVYLWDSGSKEFMTPWPGDLMELVTKNDFNEDIYKVEVDLSLYDMLIFSDGKNSQTIDIDLYYIDDGTGFYLLNDLIDGKYDVSTYIYE